jgi:uncharacterized protein YpmB
MRITLVAVILILGIIVGFVLGYTIAYAQKQDHASQPLSPSKYTDLPTTKKVPETPVFYQIPLGYYIIYIRYGVDLSEKPVSYQTPPEYPQDLIKNTTWETNDTIK